MKKPQNRQVLSVMSFRKNYNSKKTTTLIRHYYYFWNIQLQPDVGLNKFYKHILLSVIPGQYNWTIFEEITSHKWKHDCTESGAISKRHGQLIHSVPQWHHQWSGTNTPWRIRFHKHMHTSISRGKATRSQRNLWSPSPCWCLHVKPHSYQVSSSFSITSVIIYMLKQNFTPTVH